MAVDTKAKDDFETGEGDRIYRVMITRHGRGSERSMFRVTVKFVVGVTG